MSDAFALRGWGYRVVNDRTRGADGKAVSDGHPWRLAIVLRLLCGGLYCLFESLCWNLHGEIRHMRCVPILNASSQFLRYTLD